MSRSPAGERDGPVAVLVERGVLHYLRQRRVPGVDRLGGARAGVGVFHVDEALDPLLNDEPIDARQGEVAEGQQQQGVEGGPDPLWLGPSHTTCPVSGWRKYTVLRLWPHRLTMSTL